MHHDRQAAASGGACVRLMAAETAKARAYGRIVVALDGSPASEHALEWARELASLHGARVLVVSAAVPPYVEGTTAFPVAGWAYADLLDDARRRSEEIVSAAALALRDAGLHASTFVGVGQPHERVCTLAAKEEADLVVVGSHARGSLGRMMLGSVADAVKTHAPCDVLIARTAPRPPAILAALDGSAPSAISAATAASLAAAWRAALIVLHVLDRSPEGATPIQGLEMPPGVPKVTYVTSSGSPAERIASAAREHDAGLVCMGSRGLGQMRGLILGSVSNRVAHEADVSVLLVKEASA